MVHFEKYWIRLIPTNLQDGLWKKVAGGEVDFSAKTESNKKKKVYIKTQWQQEIIEGLVKIISCDNLAAYQKIKAFL